MVSESVSEGMQTEPGTEKERRAESHITTVGYQDSVRHGGGGGWLFRSLCTTASPLSCPEGEETGLFVWLG